MAGEFIEDFFGYMNLIHHLSVSENAKKTQTMIQQIVNLVKYKFYRKDEIVTLKEELLQTRNLIDIFRARFGENLNYTNTIGDEFLNIYLPNYTLNAFVENALFHGLIPKEGIWKLMLFIEEGEEYFKIQIIDSGIGFDTSILDAAYNLAANSSNDVCKITCVKSRFNSYFNNAGHIEISSCKGKGTRVGIKIPKM